MENDIKVALYERLAKSDLWIPLREYIIKQIKKCGELDAIRGNNDTEIAESFRSLKVKKSIYYGILNEVEGKKLLQKNEK